MKSLFNMIVITALINIYALSAPVYANIELTHSEFQAVNSTGEQTFNQPTEKVVLEGILLNNPADMLDPTPDDTITATFNLGAQWQFFFQGEGDDHAGTAVFMAQLYDNLPIGEGIYYNQDFIAELARLNAAQFSPGDKIRVTGYFLSYKGKNNINEHHSIDPDNNFTIELVEKGAGLPKPEVVLLDELKDADDNFVFDSTRQFGCEYYQGRLIKIEDVFFMNPDDWAPNADMTITDGLKTFPVKLGRGNGIYAGANNLTEPFDIIGIMDQENNDMTAGYRLWVMNYDGNGSVLASTEQRRADMPGDINLDGVVDVNDAIILLDNLTD